MMIAPTSTLSHTALARQDGCAFHIIFSFVVLFFENGLEQLSGSIHSGCLPSILPSSFPPCSLSSSDHIVVQQQQHAALLHVCTMVPNPSLTSAVNCALLIMSYLARRNYQSVCDKCHATIRCPLVCLTRSYDESDQP